ncbi:hypothetical protein [Streptomyces sp. NPDC020965]|uniref:hypothetical protein n=1 Tax=Streptomyces sp. NPDC020965 TaxID=3365105 RepID=UPI0037949EBE
MAVWSGRTSGRETAGRSDAPTRGDATGAPPSPAVSTAPTPTTNWLVRGKDGRLTAYAPGNESVLRWTEVHPGGPAWTGPEVIPAPGVVPYLSIAQGPDGYVHLVSLRQKRLPDGLMGTDVVYALQYQSGLAVRDWSVVGNPYPNDPALAARIGLPAAVIDQDCSLHVFVRNVGGGVCGRASVPSGKWNKWADFKGSEGVGAVSGTINDNGLMEFALPTADVIMRWAQETKGVKFLRADDIATKAEADSVSSLRTDGDRLTWFWHSAVDRTVHAWRPSMTSPTVLGTGTGTGPIALARTPVDGHDCTILAHRDAATGRPALAAYPTEDESRGVTWTVTGEPCVGVPALAVDARGKVVLAAFGTDGALMVTRQKDESGLALSAWERF